MAAIAPKTNWAEDVESSSPRESAEVPESTSVDENGIKTVIEYKINDKGQKVKVTRKIKRTLVKTQVNHAVAERLALSKFGKAKLDNNATATTVGENVKIRLNPGNKSSVKEEDDEAAKKIREALGQKSMITCRLCSGSHFTNRCPYKDTLSAVLPDSEDTGVDAPADMSAPGATTSTGKYVPPSMREGGSKRGGESMYKDSRSRDELPTLRVTNLSEDTREEDLWELFGRFARHGKLSRIYVGKDQDTGLCKGFAFVSFEDKQDAEIAMGKINGMPYDHLILACQWSVPRTDGK